MSSQVLYINLGCPWASRANLVRTLKGLEDVIQMVVLDWELFPEGWCAFYFLSLSNSSFPTALLVAFKVPSSTKADAMILGHSQAGMEPPQSIHCTVSNTSVNSTSKPPLPTLRASRFPSFGIRKPKPSFPTSLLKLFEWSALTPISASLACSVFHKLSDCPTGKSSPSHCMRENQY